MLARLTVLFRIAVGNIFASVLSVFVGLVLLFGASLLVVGGALFSTLDGSLSRSVVDSLTGHLQVYSARSKEPLEVYGKVDGSDSNLAPIPHFGTLEAKLLASPKVARVIPMGAATVLVAGGNVMDRTLSRLRALYREEPTTSASSAERIAQAQNLREHARNVVAVLKEDLRREEEISSPAALEPAARDALARTDEAAFWDDFDAAPQERLEVLENGIAPLLADADLLFMRCLGTDLDAYLESFARVALVEGTPVPRGHRGLLLPRYFREEYLKLKTARRLDRMKEALDDGRRLDDASDKELQRWLRENQAQVRELLLQLDTAGAATALERLRRFLGAPEGELSELLPELMRLTDANFAARHRFFYEQLAPLLPLYRANIGEELTLQSFGNTGAIETVTVKLYGVFELRGLEKSPLAGVNALVDLITFRELYGYLSPEREAEMAAMKASIGARHHTRQTVEAALFGDEALEPAPPAAPALDKGPSGEPGAPTASRPTATASPSPHPPAPGADSSASASAVAAVRSDARPPEPAGAAAAPAPEARRARRQRERFEPTEIAEGMVLHAAIVLRDGSEAGQRAALGELERLLGRDRPPVDRERIAAAEALLASQRLPAALAQALSPVVALERARGAEAGAGAESSPPDTEALLSLSRALKLERASLEPRQADVIDALLDGARPATWVVSWQSAAGFLGKFIDFFRLVLAGLVLTVAFIAIVIVTVGLTIATVQRTSTIGVMRAMGASRAFVVALLLTETVVLALVFGGAGAALGAGVVAWLHGTGIPAFRDELYFFFSGPVLRPTLEPAAVGVAVLVTVAVGLVAVAFPAALASRIAPVTAMQSGD